MSDTPTGRVTELNPLRAYIQQRVGGTAYIPDLGSAVESLSLECDERISSATLRVTMAAIDDAPPLTVSGVFDATATPPYDQFLSSSQRIMIARELPAAADEAAPEKQVYFSGFCDQVTYQHTDGGARISEGFTFRVESVWKRQQQRPQCQILGRWMRGREQLAALAAYLESIREEDGTLPDAAKTPYGLIEGLQHVEGFPVVFNQHGRPNRAAAPLEVPIVTGETEEEVTVTPTLVHVFCHERDPDAEFWTWAQVLRYLLVFHLLPRDAEGLPAVDAEDLASQWDLVRDGDILAATGAALTNPTPGHEDYTIIQGDMADRPALPVAVTDAMEYALLGQPQNFCVDGMTLAEALNLIVQQAGLHYRIDTTGEQAQALDADGEPIEEEGEPVMTLVPVDSLHIWARGAGPIKRFHRSAQLTDAPTSEAALLAANNLAAATLTRDDTDVVTEPDIYGGVERYECTFLLIPGWLPDENLDDVAAVDVEDVLDEAFAHGELEGDDRDSDPWYERYHKLGALFAQYRTVGRLWVLNEDGRYPACKQDAEGEPIPDGEIHARKTGPYQAAAYTPWEPTQCGIRRPTLAIEGGVLVETLEPIAADDWAPRPRPLSDCLSANEDGHSQGIVLQVAWDQRENPLAEGDPDLTAWRRLTCGFKLLSDHAAIYIEAEDLTQVIPGWVDSAGDPVLDALGNEASLWAAMVANRLHVRVTATIEGDRRVRPDLSLSSAPAPSLDDVRVRQFDLSEEHPLARRDCANSIFCAPIEGDMDPPEWRGDEAVEWETHETTRTEDLLDLQRAGELIHQVVTGRAMPGLLTVPWLTRDYCVGDTIEGIQGMGLTFWSHADTAAEVARHPDVVSVRYTASRTIVALEDTRHAEQLESGALLIDRPAREPDAGFRLEA